MTKPVISTERDYTLDKLDVSVICTPADRFTLMLPSGDAQLSAAQVALLACSMRLEEDEKFFHEMLKWFRSVVRRCPDNNIPVVSLDDTKGGMQ